MTSRPALIPIAVFVLALAVTGCARKAAEAPPQIAPAPAAAAPEPLPTPEPAAPEPVTPEPVASSPAAPPTAEFQPAFFGYDSYELGTGARVALDTDAKTLRAQPALSITVEGHCDERGTVEYNQTLGERRANAARDYLVASGVDAGRIQTISYGKDRPFAEGQGESAWSQNRRAHLVIR